MARSNLPALKPSYDLVEYHAPAPAPAGSMSTSRLEMLEERLAQQERNTQTLIERAFKIKEDVIESLSFTRGTWQEEKHAREMLAEHIRTITAVVNRLNGDIAILEEHLRVRDSASAGTSTAIKNLEVHHVATLTDLKGRVVRCDTSIAKLATDLRSCFDSVKSVGSQHQHLQTKLNDRLHSLESKIMNVANQLDRASSENKIELQHMEGGTSQQMTLLQSKTKGQFDDLHNNLLKHRATEESERDKLEARLMGHLEKSVHIRDARMDKIEKKMDDVHMSVETRLKRLEESMAQEKSRLETFQKSFESKMMGRLESELRKESENTLRLKRECREGFSTVHESITSMKTVMDGKRKLLEEQLRKEISQIRKMVVLV